MDKKVSDLEHDLIKKDIENLSFKISEAFGSIDKNLKSHFESMSVKNEFISLQLKNVMAKQDLTNGRVNRQEDITRVLSTMQKNKWLTALLLYAIYNLLEVTTMDNIIKVIKYFL